jgi:hypothetical protein
MQRLAYQRALPSHYIKGILTSELQNLVTILEAPFYFLLDPALVPVFQREARFSHSGASTITGLADLGSTRLIAELP